MTIEVHFFASLSERIGKSAASVSADGLNSVVDVWNAATDEAELPASVLVAVNQEYAKIDAPVSDGDEVAFFPPVTGG